MRQGGWAMEFRQIDRLMRLSAKNICSIELCESRIIKLNLQEDSQLYKDNTSKNQSCLVYCGFVMKASHALA